MKRASWRVATIATVAAIATGALGSLGGCSGKSDGKLRLAGARSALEKADVKADAWKTTDATKLAAQKCEQAQPGGVDAILCEYGSAEAVALGKKAGDEWVGQAVTGVVLVNGNTVLALADRNRADPNGKTIHKLSQAFQKAR